MATFRIPTSAVIADIKTRLVYAYDVVV